METDNNLAVNLRSLKMFYYSETCFIFLFSFFSLIKTMNYDFAMNTSVALFKWKGYNVHYFLFFLMNWIVQFGGCINKC